jgi:hypothetical protein
MMHRFIDNAENLEHFEDIYKSVFLSYYISLYVSNIKTKNKKERVSVNEIYDFLQDLQKNISIEIPSVEKRDISLCFYILSKLGLCHCLK